MSFDPNQSVTVAGVTTVLPRTVTQATESTFSTPDGLLMLLIQQQDGKRRRAVARLNVAKISQDPISDLKALASMSAFLVIDRPKVGFTPTEAKDVAAALASYLTAGSNARLIQMLNGES